MPLPPETVAETVTCLSGASTSLSTAVIVTVPVLVVAPAAMVSVVPACVKSPDTAGETAAADTVSVTASLDSVLRVAVTAVEPPSSSMDDEPRTSDGVAVSSSVMVRVWSDGAVTPLPPATVAETVISLSGASTSLSTAVIVTVPVLVVAPAAMVRVVPACVKSPATAGETAAAETVRVTSALDFAPSVAVTVVAPAFSLMEEALSARETVGVSSSSVMVRVWSDGAATSLPPATVAETVTCLSGASTSLSTAVMVTVPVLVVEPAAMVSVVPACVKSPATAGATAAAATVTVTSSLEAALRVAVTVVEPPFSVTDDELNARDTVGVSSSSVIVTVAAESSSVTGVEVAALTVRSKVSSGSSISSSSTVRVRSCDVWPAGTVRLPLAAV